MKKKFLIKCEGFLELINEFKRLLDTRSVYLNVFLQTSNKQLEKQNLKTTPF